MTNIDWTLGLQGLVLGLGAVFLILFILIVLISLMGKLVQKSENKKISAPEQETVKASASAQEDDEYEIIAAITAAIACMAQSEGKKYKIRSFKRV